MKKHDDEPTTTHGGARWSLPPEKRRIRVPITLSPETIKLLEPFTRNGERSKVIEAAILEYLKKDVAV